MLKDLFFSVLVLIIIVSLVIVQACDNTCAAANSLCTKQSDCVSGNVCISGSCRQATGELHSYSKEIARSSQKLLKNLKKRRLNIITAESVTGGMMISSLVDDPSYGSRIYGGVTAYDRKAKRRYLNVRTKDIYSRECALEMSAGALMTSDAAVSVAVTGKAAPVSRFDLDSLGVVDIAVSVRTDKAATGSILPADLSFPRSYTTVYKRINNCAADGHPITRAVCEKYKIEVSRGRVSPGVIELARKLIRQETVIHALDLTSNHIDHYNCYRKWDTVVCAK